MQSNETCSLASCDRRAKKRGWCGMHYLRWYRHGDPTYEAPHHTKCSMAGCDNEPRSARSGICEMHYCRRRRNGHFDLLDTHVEDPAYRTVHTRVSRARGRASTHPCVDCGGQAQHWSYTHGSMREKTSETGQPFSDDLDDYAPRCVKCHTAFDRAHALVV